MLNQMSFYSTPFSLLDSLTRAPFGSSVYVVSDSQYEEYKKREAEKEIEVLEARARAYEKTAEMIKEEIASIKKQVGLLPESTDD